MISSKIMHRIIFLMFANYYINLFFTYITRRLRVRITIKHFFCCMHILQVNMNDPLPKTACLHCIERLEAHHELMEQIMFTRQKLDPDNKAAAVASSSATTVDAAPTSSPPPC